MEHRAKASRYKDMNDKTSIRVQKEKIKNRNLSVRNVQLSRLLRQKDKLKVKTEVRDQ